MINEKELVRALAKGNILAFNALYNEYSIRIYRFALGYLKSESESEELVQEVFTKIWEKRDHLNEELSFKSFLFTIAFNIIRKHFRTKASLSAYYKFESGEKIDFQTTQKVIYDSLYQYISEIIDQLPARRKAIFISSRIEGCTISEIAERLNISHKTVENQLTDALRIIRSKLNSENLPVALFFALFLS